MIDGYCTPYARPGWEKLQKDIGAACIKYAGTPEVSFGLAGRLYLSKSGYILLSVPNALGRGAFEALDELGVELPLNDSGMYEAHISVLRKEEIDSIGGPDKITERGKMFHYTLGPVKCVKPDGWSGISKCWFITVNSPELKALRRSYGLSSLPKNDEFEFHITVGVKKTGVLFANDTTKSSEERGPEGEYCPNCDARLERDSYTGTCNSCGKPWPKSANFLADPNTVSHAFPGVTQQSLTAQLHSPSWSPQQSIWQNLLSNYNQATNRDMQWDREAESAFNFAKTLSPNLAFQRAMKSLSTPGRVA